jgi:hypothetical protein
VKTADAREELLIQRQAVMAPRPLMHRAVERLRHLCGWYIRELKRTAARDPGWVGFADDAGHQDAGVILRMPGSSLLGTGAERECASYGPTSISIVTG